MNPNDTSDMPLDIIHLDDASGDGTAQQLTAYRHKAQMLLRTWRRRFGTQDANRDYILEDGEDAKLRSSNDNQLLAEHTLADHVRIRFDYDEARAKDKLIVSAYEASGEALVVEATLAEQYDQMAGLLFTCAAIDKAH